ncbi:hypothetical protein P0D88_02275 [Paraburkholderia sp. RL18-103-BIB-C]|jgi:hypothetical protein
MTQPNSQPIHALFAQPVVAVAGGVSALAPGMRTVAFSLLVDRALSA